MIDALARIVRFVHAQGAAAGMQLAHSGRKGSTKAPWRGLGAVPPAEGGWPPAGPTAEPFADGYPIPRAFDTTEIPGIVKAFKEAAGRALAAGFDVIEVHSAHGYLLHEFLSPLTNHRTDAYGGTFDNRLRLCLDVVDAVRSVWPATQPVFVRISATDWVDGGWDVEQSIELARRLRQRGVDLVDCSSGGNSRLPASLSSLDIRCRSLSESAVRLASRPARSGSSRRRSKLMRSCVAGRADCVLLARELLRDPYWPLRAARELGHHVPWPPQYLRAAPAGSPECECRPSSVASRQSAVGSRQSAVSGLQSQ